MPRNPSPAQSEAARQNGRRSAGPVTSEGKARAARNAVTFGFRSSELVVLEGDDEDLFKEMQESIRARFEPESPIEEMICSRIVAALWRSERAQRLESSFWCFIPEDVPVDDPHGLCRTLFDDQRTGMGSLPTILRYLAESDQALARALRNLALLRSGKADRRPPDEEPPPDAPPPASAGLPPSMPMPAGAYAPPRAANDHGWTAQPPRQLPPPAERSSAAEPAPCRSGHSSPPETDWSEQPQPSYEDPPHEEARHEEPHHEEPPPAMRIQPAPGPALITDSGTPALPASPARPASPSPAPPSRSASTVEANDTNEPKRPSASPAAIEAPAPPSGPPAPRGSITRAPLPPDERDLAGHAMRELAKLRLNIAKRWPTPVRAMAEAFILKNGPDGQGPPDWVKDLPAAAFKSA